MAAYNFSKRSKAKGSTEGTSSSGGSSSSVISGGYTKQLTDEQVQFLVNLINISTITYDTEGNATITFNSNVSTQELYVDSEAHIEGDMRVMSDFKVDGDITADGDITSNI